MKIARLTTENKILFTVYLLLFIIFIFQDAIYSPDTYSYINANIYRSPGYPIFSKFLIFLFGKYFDFAIVAIQLIISFFSIHLFYITVSKTIQLNWFEKIPLFVILIFPIFNPLLFANNICSEGLSYPLYLLFLAFSINFLKSDNLKSFYLLLATCIVLALTRGQFIILPFIVSVLYFIIHKKNVFKKVHLKKIILIFLLPFVITIMDKSYHLLKDGVFVSTPFTFLCMSGSAFYVSEISDAESLQSKNDKDVFNECYAFLDKNGWLLSSRKRESYKQYYNHFHNNLGNICNYTVHDRGTQYYLDKGLPIVQARVALEKTCKNLVSVLIKNNFKKWLKLYYSNLIHSFKSQFVLFIIISILLFSLIRSLINNTIYSTYLLFFSMLIVSNALIITLASHSIMRYLVYNYSLIFLLFVILIKFLRHGRKA